MLNVFSAFQIPTRANATKSTAVFHPIRNDRVTVLTDTSCKTVLKLGAPTTHICFKCQPDNMGVTGQNSLVCALQEVKP